MKRKFASVFLMFILACTMNTPALAATMYAPDGRTIEVHEADVTAWQNVGWYTCPVTKMYATDGRSILVASSDVWTWKNVGWYEYPVSVVYAPDGRTNVVSAFDVWAWKNVGWYEYPVMTVYATDGRTAVIASSDLHAWQSVGWSPNYIPSQDVISSYTNYTWWDLKSQRCNMKMTYLYGNYFKITIHWSGGYDNGTTWEMTAALGADGTLTYQDCICYTAYYPDGGYEYKITNYENGVGNFTLQNGMYIWNNITENVYDYCCFMLG